MDKKHLKKIEQVTNKIDDLREELLVLQETLEEVVMEVNSK